LALGLAKAMLNVTRNLVIINADYASSWNERKRLVLSGYQSARDELKFLDFVFTKHVKSAEGWEHRRWVVRQCFREAAAAHVNPDVIVRHELRICAKVAQTYSRNYYSWTHRLFVLKETDSKEILESELAFSTKWVNEHAPDHSGWHYRQQVLIKVDNYPKVESVAHASDDGICQSALLQGRQYNVGLWRDEFKFLKTMVDALPGHETLWAHARFIFSQSIQGATREPLIAPQEASKQLKILAKELLLYSQKAGERAKDAVFSTRFRLWAYHWPTFCAYALSVTESLEGSEGLMAASEPKKKGDTDDIKALLGLRVDPEESIFAKGEPGTCSTSGTGGDSGALWIQVLDLRFLQLLPGPEGPDQASPVKSL